MGRGVAVPRDAVAVAYLDFDEDIVGKLLCFEEDGGSYPDWAYWEDFLGFVVSHVCSVAPSMYSSDTWLGDELRVVAENGHAYVGVSEYAGLVAVWVVPKEEGGLAEAWAWQMADKLLEPFDRLRKIATASNGGSLFRRVA